MFLTPVLIIVFNRPNETKLLLELLEKVKPKYLYVSADGPRLNNSNDIVDCAITRDLITQKITWDCELKTLFRDKNLGCRFAPAEAITWFFSHVEKGLIVEDDCLLDLSFFNFAEEMLNFYEHNERVMHIAASSTIKLASNKSFSFSIYPAIWGWATWKRAWEKFDISIPDWIGDKEKRNLPLYKRRKRIVSYFERRFDAVYNYTPLDAIEGGSNTWDYQWNYCLLKHDGVAIIPQNNLVKNIGFGSTATHTKDDNSPWANRETTPLTFPLVYPKKISTHKTDTLLENEFLNIKTTNIFYRAYNKVKKIINSIKSN